MMRVFLSDLHLESPHSPQFQTLAALLQTESARCDSIYLLGDLCEVWIGDDNDDELACSLTALLRRTAADCNLYLMHGNRDFLFGPAFANATGVQLLADPHQLEDGTLLSHGDAYCVDDTDYQQARSMLRSESWQQQVLAQPLAARRQLADSMRAQSRAASENKAANIMDVSASALAEVMRATQSQRLIHGHTHRPGVHQESWGERYVLGDWDHCGWLLRQHQQNLQLECFPLTLS